MDKGEVLVTFTEEYARQRLDEQVKAAGGRKQWLRKHRVNASVNTVRDIQVYKSHPTNEGILKAIGLIS